MSVDKLNTFVKTYWAVLLAVVSLAFYAGVTDNRLENKVDRVELNEIVKQVIVELATQQKDSYVQIDKIPGLAERLQSIETSIDDNKELTKQIYEIVIKRGK